MGPTAIYSCREDLGKEIFGYPASILRSTKEEWVVGSQLTVLATVFMSKVKPYNIRVKFWEISVQSWQLRYLNKGYKTFSIWYIQLTEHLWEYSGILRVWNL